MATGFISLLFLFCFNTFAQSTSFRPISLEPKTNTSQRIFSQNTLEKIKSKFKVNYFSETLGPSIQKLDDNEISDQGTKNREPLTMYNSLNVRYTLTDKFNLFVSPRFNIALGDRNDLRPTQEQNVFYSDDWQFGVFYTFLKTKSFQYNQRLTHREPFSRKSRFENIDSQIEWQHDYSYAFTPALRGILWNNYRYYAYNGDSEDERYRISFTTLLNYTINDKWNTQLMHELDLQHRNPKDANSPEHKNLNFVKRNKNYISLGVGYSPVMNFSIIPFVRILDERNIRNETTVLGLWMLGRLI